MPDVTNISVRSGGENLYITPVALSKDIMENKVDYYVMSEFKPTNPDVAPFFYFNWIIGQYTPASLATRNKVKAYAYLLKQWVLYGVKHKVRFVFYKTVLPRWLALKDLLAYHNKDWYWFKTFFRHWRLHTEVRMPMLVISNPELRFVVYGQLAVVDPDRLTETYYLIPSQLYLRQRVEELCSLIDEIDINRALKEIERYGYYEHKEYSIFKNTIDDVLKYNEWSSNMRLLGRDIFYIAELDT